MYGDSGAGIGVYGSSGAPNTLVNAGVVGVSTGFNGIGVRGVADNGTNTWAVYGHSTSGYAGYFDGKVQVNGTFINNSDARLKTKIADLSSGLSAVMRLRPVTWKWKKDPNGRPQLGLVAQEVEPVLPELVEPGADKDRLLGMNYIGLVPVVIKAIQEQQSTIIKLQRENAALEARVV